MKTDIRQPTHALKEKNRHALLSYWDRDLVCRFANADFRYWFGETPENAVGKTTLKVLLGAAFDQHMPLIESALDGYKESELLEMEVESGKTIQVEACYFPDPGPETVAGFFLCLSEQEPLDSTYLNTQANTAGLQSGQHNGPRDCMIRVSRYLQNHLLSEFPTIKEIARAHLISPSKLMRDFRLIFGTSPHEYYRILQMEFAERYLESTGCPKKTVAMMLGFSNPTNFNLRYKRYLDEKDSAAKASPANTRPGTDHDVLIRQVPVALAVLDVNRQFLLASEKWLAEFHPDSQDVLGKSFVEFFPEHNINWPATQPGKSRVHAKPQRTCLHDRNGNRHELSLTIRPWTDHSGKPVGSIICAIRAADLVI
ncbi:hypothetical protein C7T94_11655 [Pedobacter yulinensis]|uniref:HTH araC/xylS-type domain-containing protein n=1 Tax=Pedobacter yulinensis TaxID=2126353 RepID=A0A2T3HLH4_9SPHI|nr:PAS domain-containing protein [Pedobacter yulinensis]PST83241.1 hypothetical protein C7T94_11655 [Pedobacter yulinensis]